MNGVKISHFLNFDQPLQDHPLKCNITENKDRKYMCIRIPPIILNDINT